MKTLAAQPIQIGIDSFVSAVADPATGLTMTSVERMRNLLEEVERADQVGLDAFGVGEHHRREFFDSAPAVILAAAAARTKQIRLNSAVTVLGADDPVRVFQSFATLDLISGGRAEMVVGRGSFIEAFPLFGLDLDDYDSLFAEKLDLLLQIRDNPEHVRWSGKYRPALTGQGCVPAPGADAATDLARRRRHPAVLRSSGDARTAAHGGDHRWRATPLPAARRPVPRGRPSGRPSGRAAHSWPALSWLYRRHRPTSGRRLLPGYAEMFGAIGKERGFAPPSRSSFDAQRGPTGALFIGNPETVAEKVLSVSDALGGISRLTFQMTNVRLAHKKMLHSIELLGTRVAPLVRNAHAANVGAVTQAA